MTTAKPILRMQLLIGSAAIVALMAFTSAAPGTSAAGPSGRADAKVGRALARLVGMRRGPPAAVAVVQRRSQRKVIKRGVANLSSGARIGIGKRWRIASVAKAFSGAVALRLVERGKLALDDTIAERLPSLPAAWGSVTLGEALQHTAGLPDYIESARFERFAGRHPRRYVGPLTLIGYVADEPLDFAPGSRYHYSDTDNIVAALFAEAASGLSYDRLLNKLVVDPLALRRTSLPLGFRMPTPFVHGYDTNERGRAEDVSEILNPNFAWASGGMVSSPLDLTRFVRAYAGGELVSGPTRAAQLQFVPGTSGPPGPGTNASGLGIYRYRTRCGVVYGHTGNVAGYTAFIAASRNGRRSATVQVSTQLSALVRPRLFRVLRRAESLAVCAALAT